jgi:hypothetical protein
LNIFSSATLWCIWSLRNEMCFQGVKWCQGNPEKNWEYNQILEDPLHGQTQLF